jgi:hypothetical protein
LLWALRRAMVMRAARAADAIERERSVERATAPEVPSPDHDISMRLDALQATVESQVGLISALQQRLHDVQSLVARSYEAAFDWRSELAAVRSDPTFEDAWTLITVRIATYNNAHLLCERTLPSVLSQTYDRWEAIVVGDAVTDDTATRIAALGDSRIRFINLPFRGPYPEEDYRRWLVAGTAPMNRATRDAHGAWIAPLDHDDEWEPDHIEVLLENARKTHAELVYGKLRMRDAATGTILPRIVGAWPPVLSEFGLQGAI